MRQRCLVAIVTRAPNRDGGVGGGSKFLLKKTSFFMWSKLFPFRVDPYSEETPGSHVFRRFMMT